MRILFLVPYPAYRAPSQRFRFEQYMDALESRFGKTEQVSFLDERAWHLLYQEGNKFEKVLAVLKGYVRRMVSIWHARNADFVFIHREITPLGPPLFEWVLAKIFKKRIIYDFDDAIWLEDESIQGALVSKLKYHSKVTQICRWSYKVSCGNAYLADYASQFNSQVVLNPTTVDTENLHVPKKRKNGIPVIGWTGTHSTNKYLRPLQPVLVRLAESHDFVLKVISNQKPDFELANLDFVLWREESEIEDLASIDIGVMPLPDDKWARGKCGFKALQYMSLEIPALVSPVGVNVEIVDHGLHGYHCSSEEEWYNRLSELLSNPSKRQEMGEEGRNRVKARYSVLSNTDNFLSLFS